MLSALSSIFERIFVRDAIGATRHKISKTLTVIETERANQPIILRFCYPGNIQYHRLSVAEMRQMQPYLDKYTQEEAIK